MAEIKHTGPIFIGSWAPICFRLKNSDVNIDEIHFEIPKGPSAGIVSFAREQGNAKEPLVPFLVAGGLVGVHDVLLYHTRTGRLLGQSTFEVTSIWKDLNAGPPGFHTFTPFPAGRRGWGDDSTNDRPQNMDVKPHSGTWTIMILLVDTADRRWPDAPGDTTTDDFRTTIMNHMVNGISIGSRNCSVQRYFDEIAPRVSDERPGLKMKIYQDTTFGVLHLQNSWESYLYQPWLASGDNRWVMQFNALEAVIKEARDAGTASTDDLKACDAVAVVPYDADDLTGSRYTWPAAWWKFNKLVGDDAGNAEDRHDIAQLWMTPEWPSRDGRQIFATASHELGHTLDLLDLYSKGEYGATVRSRIVSGYEMMVSDSDTLPHFSLSNKMRLGWVAEEQIKTFNIRDFSRDPKSVTLHPARYGTGIRGVELRLADGWNYIVEFRNAPAAGEITDAHIVGDGVIMITDTNTDTFVSSLSRPNVLFVAPDPDGDGWLLDPGKDLRETDPQYAKQLTVKVDSISPSQADLTITYNSNGRPDPGIRSWDGARTNWKSPDIEVRNVRSTANPTLFFNTPWLGHSNQVIATVKNSGDRIALGVTVEFFSTEFTTGEGPWESLGTRTHDIDVDASVSFEVEWSPPAAEGRHYCIIARIQQYQDPNDPTVLETNIFNNEARSNYWSFISASASPSERVRADVSLSNPFEEESLVHAEVRGGHWAHRIFTEYTWLRVAGKSERKIKVWEESIVGTQQWEPFHGKEKEVWKAPSEVSVQGVVSRPAKGLRCLQREVTGGVGMTVHAARKTEIEIHSINPEAVEGEVVFVDKGVRDIGGGKILIDMIDEARTVTRSFDLADSWRFAIKFDDVRPVEIVLHYLGEFSVAPCESERLDVRR